MAVNVTRWAHSTPPDAATLLSRLHESGQVYSTWGNMPGDTYTVRSNTYDKYLVRLRGSVRFTLPATGDAVDLAPGDELHLPAGARHGAIVGPDGVQCAEAHLPVA